MLVACRCRLAVCSVTGVVYCSVCVCLNLWSMYCKVWFDLFHVRVGMTKANRRSVTDLSTRRRMDQVHSARSLLVVTHPSTNQSRRAYQRQ